MSTPESREEARALIGEAAALLGLDASSLWKSAKRLGRKPAAATKKRGPKSLAETEYGRDLDDLAIDALVKKNGGGGSDLACARSIAAGVVPHTWNAVRRESAITKLANQVRQRMAKRDVFR